MSRPLVFMMGRSPAILPTDRQYARNHMWAMETEGECRFGLSAYAVRLLGDVQHLRWSIKVGDSVKFVNEDPFSHNVFSLSSVKSFDLGSYPQGGAKSVTFDKAGSVEVECAIHPDMTLAIEVEK